MNLENYLVHQSIIKALISNALMTCISLIAQVSSFIFPQMLALLSIDSQVKLKT